MQTVKLNSLKEGSPFLFPQNEHFKFLYLIKSGNSRCRIKGFKKINSAVWEGFEDDCSPDAEVIKDNGRDEIEIITNEFGIHKTNKLQEINPPKVHITKEKKRLELPINTEFTVKEIAEKLNIESYTVSNEIARRKKNNKDSVIIVGYKQGGRGKPQCIFKLTE